MATSEYRRLSKRLKEHKKNLPVKKSELQFLCEQIQELESKGNLRVNWERIEKLGSKKDLLETEIQNMQADIESIPNRLDHLRVRHKQMKQSTALSISQIQKKIQGWYELCRTKIDAMNTNLKIRAKELGITVNAAWRKLYKILQESKESFSKQAITNVKMLVAWKLNPLTHSVRGSFLLTYIDN